jgi:hypothetical protein
MWVASFPFVLRPSDTRSHTTNAGFTNPKQIEHHTSARNRLVRNIQNMLEKYWATLSTS